MNDPSRRGQRSNLRRCGDEHDPSTAAPPIVHEVLRSPGTPLDSGTRTVMEPRFGHDFSRVRIHTDDRAAESARAVNALAYTVGSDIVFGQQQFAPTSPTGQRLLAHELTHVVQQGTADTPVQRQLVVGEADDDLERAASSKAASITSGS